MVCKGTRCAAIALPQHYRNASCLYSAEAKAVGKVGEGGKMSSRAPARNRAGIVTVVVFYLRAFLHTT